MQKQDRHQTPTAGRVKSLLRACKCELERLQGRELSYQELGRYAGQAASTVFNRLQTTEHSQVEALLRWLERLPKAVREDLLDEACREYPTLTHERLGHDPIMVSRLREVLRAQHGLVLITGGDEAQRTFLATALAHSNSIVVPERRVIGLDRYCPDWFVPVDGVQYLGEQKTPAEIETGLRLLRPTRSELVLMNGVVAASAEALKVCAGLSRSHLVLVSDSEQAFSESRISKLPSGTKRLFLSLGSKDRINVRLEHIDP